MKESVSFVKKNDTGDEFHYLFVCNHFKSERKNFLMPYFYKRPNIIKIKELLSTENENPLDGPKPQNTFCVI